MTNMGWKEGRRKEEGCAGPRAWSCAEAQAPRPAMAGDLRAAIAGLAGALNAHLTFFIGPNEFGFDRGVEILTMTKHKK